MNARDKSTLVVHPGGGQGYHRSWFDDTLGKAFLQWGVVGGQYEIALGGKRAGQLIGGSGWQITDTDLRVYQIQRDNWKARQKREKKKASKNAAIGGAS